MNKKDNDAGETKHIICSLCEAGCGLIATVEGDKVQSIRGNPDDVLSRGHVCPKGVALMDLHNDPDRLRAPMIKGADGWAAASWDDALDLVAGRLHDFKSRSGPDSIGVYGGNPTAHILGAHTHFGPFLQQLGTRNIYSAASLDILPVQLAAFLLYGNQYLLPVPDIDRTQHLLVIGANPMVSNGSMMMVPDFPGRLRELKKRGGRMVVIDPRRTETARSADAHHFIRPGSDAFLLLAMLGVLFKEDRLKLGEAALYVDGVEAVRAVCERVPLGLAAERTGVAAEDIRALALDFADAESAACYGRIGVSVQEYGSLCQWAIQALNILTGNFDRPGGVMFTEHLAPPAPTAADAGGFARWTSRVSGLPEFGGLMPAAVLAEEILTAGEGQIRALMTLAGNPARSAPNSARMDEALRSLEFFVAIDLYLNESNQHADVILAPVSQLQRSHYPMFTARYGVRNVVRYTPPVLSKGEGERQDWEILSGLTQRLAVLADVERQPVQTPEEILSQMLAESARPDITIEKLIAEQNGFDLGALGACMPDRLSTVDKHINLECKTITADIDNLLGQPRKQNGDKLLVGRRSARSNNSWMHNLPRLMARRPDHHLLVHPDDAAFCGIENGAQVELRTQVGVVSVEARISDEIMPGSVCLPHGWDHREAGASLAIASSLPGANFNMLVDEKFIDRPSAGSAFQAVPCTLKRKPR